MTRCHSIGRNPMREQAGTVAERFGNASPGVVGPVGGPFPPLSGGERFPPDGTPAAGRVDASSLPPDDWTARPIGPDEGPA